MYTIGNIWYHPYSEPLLLKTKITIMQVFSITGADRFNCIPLHPMSLYLGCISTRDWQLIRCSLGGVRQRTCDLCTVETRGTCWKFIDWVESARLFVDMQCVVFRLVSDRDVWVVRIYHTLLARRMFRVRFPSWTREKVSWFLRDSLSLVRTSSRNFNVVKTSIIRVNKNLNFDYDCMFGRLTVKCCDTH